MKSFHLVRSEDVSGVSGTGVVAEGVVFESGKAVLCWRGDLSSVSVHESIDSLIAIHGHEGRTQVQFLEAA